MFPHDHSELHKQEKTARERERIARENGGRLSYRERKKEGKMEGREEAGGGEKNRAGNG